MICALCADDLPTSEFQTLKGTGLVRHRTCRLCRRLEQLFSARPRKDKRQDMVRDYGEATVEALESHRDDWEERQEAADLVRY